MNGPEAAAFIDATASGTSTLTWYAGVSRTGTTAPCRARCAASAGLGGWWSRYAVWTGRPGARARTLAASASTPRECRVSGEPWASSTMGLGTAAVTT